MKSFLDGGCILDGGSRLGDRTCPEVHPRTGDTCVLQDSHNNPNNPAPVRQHMRADGDLKWPDIRVLNPDEGFNGPQPRYL